MDRRESNFKLQRSGSLAEVVNIHRKTCADVIRESKILVNYDGVKSIVSTKRPETPRDDGGGYENYRIGGGDSSAKKPTVSFSANSGMDFDISSRPSSSYKRLDPLKIDRKVRSASSGAKVTRREKSLKPVEAFQNFSMKSPSSSGRNARKENKLRRDCSVEEIKGYQMHDMDPSFFVEGKKCENMSPPKKPRQAVPKYQHGNQEFQSKHSAIKTSNQRKHLDSNSRNAEEAKLHLDLDADDAKKLPPSGTIKINVTIPIPQVVPTSHTVCQSQSLSQSNQYSSAEQHVSEVFAYPSSNVLQAEDETEFGNSGLPDDEVDLKKCHIVKNVSGMNYDAARENDENHVLVSASQEVANDDDDEAVMLRLLEDLKMSSKVEDPKILKAKLKNFHDELRDRDLLGKKSRHRSRILKFIISLIDLDCPSLILNVCKMMLSLKVSGGNLLNVTKLLLKLSGDKANIKRFAEEDVIDSIEETASGLLLGSSGHETASSSSSDSIQSLLNLWSTIKTLSSSSCTVKLLASDAMIGALVSSFSFAKQLKCAKGKHELENVHLKMLILLTSTTRNLLDAPNATSDLVASGVVERLFEALKVSNLDESVAMNVVRALSKMTMQNDCCLRILNDVINIEHLTNVLKKFNGNEDIVLRVTFALGNMAAKHDKFRLDYLDVDESLPVITKTYSRYLKVAVKEDKLMRKVGNTNKSVKDDGTNSMEHLKKIEDILVKLLRLVANLTINEEVGLKVVEDENCVLVALDTLEYERLTQCDELLINVFALLNNLSFYVSPTSALTTNQLQLVQGLKRFLVAENVDHLSDIIRVICNLSRDKDVRNNLTNVGVNKFLLQLLDAESNEIVFSACGALINFMIDPLNRISFRQDSGVERVIGILETFGENDWQLAGMACQILCNYCLGFDGKDSETLTAKEEEEEEEEEAGSNYGQEKTSSDGCHAEALFLSEEIPHILVDRKIYMYIL